MCEGRNKSILGLFIDLKYHFWPDCHVKLCVQGRTYLCAEINHQRVLKMHLTTNFFIWIK